MTFVLNHLDSLRLQRQDRRETVLAAMVVSGQVLLNIERLFDRIEKN